MSLPHAHGPWCATKPPTRVDYEIATRTAIRRVLNEYGGLARDANELGDDADLCTAGMSSHATVDVLIELEDRFGIEFPAHMLGRRSFGSIAAIDAAIAQLRPGSFTA